MTDIVPTLRSLATAPAHEAADEIERLTAELANAEWRCRSIDAQWMREVERLRALVARKSQALQEAALCLAMMGKSESAKLIIAEAEATEPLK